MFSLNEQGRDEPIGRLSAENFDMMLGVTDSLEKIVAEFREMLGVRYMAVSLIAADHGLFERLDIGGITHVPYHCAPCVAIVEAGRTVCFSDMDKIERFKNNPFVADFPCVRSYLGTPVFGPKRRIIGTICGFDPEQRSFSSADAALLETAAWAVRAHLEIITIQRGLRGINDMRSLLGAVDYFADLGYREVTEYLISFIYRRHDEGEMSLSA